MRSAQSRSLLPVLENERVLRISETSGYRVAVDETDARLSVELHEPAPIRTRADIRTGAMIRVIRDTELDVEGDDDQPLPKGPVLRVEDVLFDRWVKVTIQRSGLTHCGWVPTEDVELVQQDYPISPSISSLLSEWGSWGPVFVPASVLIQKAKVFDDGLMAAVQRAAQEGIGPLVGKSTWLKQVAQLAQSGPERIAELLQAALQLGRPVTSVPSEVEPGVSSLVTEFLADSFRSKPLGLYSSTPDLREIFRQDRMLQSRVRVGDLSGFAKILKSDLPAREACERYLDLMARLTNPPAHPDLRTVLAGKTVENPDVPFLSPARGPETDLVSRMFGETSIPEGFDLLGEVVSQVRSGEMSLQPREDSGWYDRQLWSLEPLVRHRETEEARKWIGNQEYEKHLESTFKGAWALIRETHLKDLDGPIPGSAMGKRDPIIRIRVCPQLTTEPLATMYRRRAESYRYLLSTLQEVLGEFALAKLYRPTLDGQTETPLDQELQQMIQLFEGAAVTVERELGITFPNRDESERTRCAQEFLDWADGMHQDPDLTIDCRCMVPLYYDIERQKTKALVFLGWTSRNMTISYSTAPQVSVFQADGVPVSDSRVKLSIQKTGRRIMTPVVYETLVKDVLDQVEFRELCDRVCSPQEILRQIS